MRSSTPYRVLLAVALVVTAAPAVAQRSSALDDDRWLDECRRGWNDDSRGRACEVRVVPIKLSGRSIDVDGRQNGSVRVEGWDNTDVKVVARIQTNAESDRDAADLLKDVRINSDDRRITADGPRTDRGWRNRDHWSVSYVVYVPRRFDVALDASNGSLAVTGVNGRMDLRTENGSVTLTDIGGDVRAHTQNGSLSVQLAGAKWDGSGLDAETQNGSVRMGIPSSYAAQIETGTVNGHVTTDFPVTLQGRIGRTLSLPLNGGGTRLRATTTNGSVTLSRR
ncbi:MAG: DUF4097 family beta strand repeat-containing protein [Gemmatimonadota bacterium]